jgi:hypothetical protein
MGFRGHERAENDEPLQVAGCDRQIEDPPAHWRPERSPGFASRKSRG